MKKTVAICICLILAMSMLLSACGGGGEPGTTQGTQASEAVKDQSTQNAVDSNYTEVGTFPIVKDKITLSMFVVPSQAIKLDSWAAEDGNQFSIWFEKYTNIHLDMVQSPSETEVTQNLNLLIASGNYPDILFPNIFSPLQQLTYGSQGVLLELSDLINKYAPNVTKMYNEHPETKDAVTLDNGKIYAFNGGSIERFGVVWNMMWVYKPWLDKLSLAVPTTTDEFYNVLKAFKTQDPNGNKKADEIPLLGNTSWIAYNPVTYIMNSFIYNNEGQRHLFIKNGEVVAAYNQPQWRKGLEYMNKLYSEGLITSDTFTADFDTCKRLLDNADTPLVGFISSHAPFAETAKRWQDFVPVPPLKGPDGFVTASREHMVRNTGVTISAKCKYPEAAVRLIDALYQEEVMLNNSKGRENIEWRYAKPGEGNGSNGKPALYVDLTNSNMYDVSNKNVKNIMWSGAWQCYFDTGVNEGFLINTEDDTISSAEYSIPLDKATLDYIPFLPKISEILPLTLLFSEADAATLAEMETSIYNYVIQQRVKFITGEDKLDDAGWNKYLNELKSLKLDTLLKMYQDSYNKKMGK